MTVKNPNQGFGSRSSAFNAALTGPTHDVLHFAIVRLLWRNLQPNGYGTALDATETQSAIQSLVDTVRRFNYNNSATGPNSSPRQQGLRARLFCQDDAPAWAKALGGNTRSTGANGVTTSGSPTVTCTGAAFSGNEVGLMVTGTGIPAQAWIKAVNSTTSITLGDGGGSTASNVNATSSHTNVVLSIVGVKISGTNAKQGSIPASWQTPTGLSYTFWDGTVLANLNPVEQAYCDLLNKLSRLSIAPTFITGSSGPLIPPGTTVPFDDCPEIREMACGLTGNFFPEVFQRHADLGTPTNGQTLGGLPSVVAGISGGQSGDLMTNDKDVAAMKIMVRSQFIAFKNVRLWFGSDPYQRVDGTTVYTGSNSTQTLWDYALGLYPSGAITLGNSDFGLSGTNAGGEPFLQFMAKYGPTWATQPGAVADPTRNNTCAISVQAQPASWTSSELATVFARAVQYGLSSMELPSSATTPSSMIGSPPTPSYDQQIVNNWSTFTPPPVITSFTGFAPSSVYSDGGTNIVITGLNVNHLDGDLSINPNQVQPVSGTPNAAFYATPSSTTATTVTWATLPMPAGAYTLSVLYGGTGANLLSNNAASIETDISGWVAPNPGHATISQTTAQALNGTHALAITLTSSFLGLVATMANAVTVQPNTMYTAVMSMRSAATPRQWSAFVAELDAGGLVTTSHDSPPGVDSSTSTWRQWVTTFTTGSTTVGLKMSVNLTSTGANGEVHYMDCAQVALGSTTAWTLPGTTGTRSVSGTLTVIDRPPPPPPPDPPAITSVVPSQGPDAGGTAIVVRGTGFTNVQTVTVNSVGVTGFSVDSPTQISTSTPPSGALVLVGGAYPPVHTQITNDVGQSTLTAADLFTYLPVTIPPPPPPTVTPARVVLSASLATRVIVSAGTSAMSQDVFSVGDVAKVRARFFDVDTNISVDPTVVEFSTFWNDHPMAVTQLLYGRDAALLREGIGRYVVQVALPHRGTLIAKYVSSGAHTAASSVQLTVVA